MHHNAMLDAMLDAISFPKKTIQGGFANLCPRAPVASTVVSRPVNSLEIMAAKA